MYGEPEDKEGQCNARLFLGDNFGDNHCTVVCQLGSGHEGQHQEISRDGTVTIQWSVDERFSCPKHGIQSIDYCQICNIEDAAREQDLRCDACLGFGTSGIPTKETEKCVFCQGTGYDSKRHPELMAECLRDGTNFLNREWDMKSLAEQEISSVESFDDKGVELPKERDQQ